MVIGNDSGAFGRRLLLLVDARSYGSADVPLQREYQDAIHALIDKAATAAALEPEAWERQLAGDSQFAVLPADASEPALVDRFMRELESGLRLFNRNRIPEAWLRLRAAVHFGDASRGGNGFVGRGPVHVARICNSKALHTALDAAPEACLAVCVSGTVFNDVVAQAYTTIRAADFREVLVEEKEFRDRVWLWVPGYDAHGLDLGDAVASAEPARSPSGSESSAGSASSAPRAPLPRGGSDPVDSRVQMSFHGDVHAEHGVFGINYG